MTKLTKAQKAQVDEEVDAVMSDPNFVILYWGTRYKFGAHGFVYRWSDTSEGWMKSDMEPATLRTRVRSNVIRQLINDDETL